MTISHAGTCLCKKVSFTVKGQPNAVFCCYCGDCAKGAGGPCQITASYFSSEFTLYDPDNAVTRYEIVNGTVSGHPKNRFFCSYCGCTLFTIPTSDGAQETVIRPVLIDNGLKIFKPTIECFIENRPPEYLGACESAK